MTDPDVDPRIKPYLDALEEEGESWRVRPSTTWKVLNRLHSEHGEQVVQNLLNEHWARERAKKETG